jgi:hypothetical protein
MTQSYRGYPTPASCQNQGVIDLSFLTPEEIMIKKQKRKTMMYVGIFSATGIVVAGTTLLTYGF